MRKQTMTLGQYQQLYERLRDVQITQSDGLLIITGEEARRGVVVALHSLASPHVIIVRPDQSSPRAEPNAAPGVVAHPA